MEAKVLDFNGKVQLSDSVFGIEPNNHAVYLDVKQYLANQRQAPLLLLLLPPSGKVPRSSTRMSTAST
jgi:hypothetical protein